MNENENSQGFTVSGNEIIIPVDKYLESLQITIEDTEEASPDYSEDLKAIRKDLSAIKAQEMQVSENTVSENTVDWSDPVGDWSLTDKLLGLNFFLTLFLFVCIYIGFFNRKRF